MLSISDQKLDPPQIVRSPQYMLDERTTFLKPSPRAGRDIMGLARFAVIAALGLAASSAVADEKTTYLYDGQGRVTAATIARSSGASTYVAYTYDDADNRERRRTVSVPVRAASNELRMGEEVIPQQSIFSADGRFQLVFQKEGNVVLYFGVTPLWGTPTAMGQSMVLAMQADGNLVLYDPQFTPLWASNTAGNPGAFLRVQNDGNVVMYVGSTQVWATNTCCH